MTRRLEGLPRIVQDALARAGDSAGGLRQKLRKAGEVTRVNAMRKKRSKVLDAVNATARGLHAADAIDQVSMREFDQLCLKPVSPLRPAEIRRIRESANVSQAVFAAILNTSKSSVQKWEIGQKRPTGTALKLLHLVQKNGLEAVS